MHHETDGPWRDISQPAADRVRDLISRMTLEEKLAQLSSVWPGADAEGEDVAPLQHEVTAASPHGGLDALLPHGLGQLTRPFGTAPVTAAEGVRALAATQARVMAGNRFGIPAIAHEECLTGFTTWGATVFPTPLAWGASFDPALVGRAAGLIGASLRAAGVHQGLSPVLDVVRDPRWGRTEESVSEDPYLVATVGTAYVRGLEDSGVIATLKHFAGYAGSRGARNHAPVAAGPRELADVVLPPFELALRDGGARSVMHAYNDIDGVPAAADPSLLTGLLREEWGFTGTVVADYFGVSFLELAHGVAGSPREAAALALSAGVDVELPAVRCYGEPLREAVRAGEVAEALVDRALARVLGQKCALGMLDPGWDPRPGVASGADPGSDADADADLDLDPAEMRDVARQLAEESVVLLADDGGVLPLTARPGSRIAVIGPQADDPAAMLGCYTFPRHVGVEHPGLPLGVEIPTLLAALRDALPDAEITHAPGCPPPGPATGNASAAPGPDADAAAGQLAEAVALASEAEVCVAVVGDRSGLFGRGTSGEGCDAPDLDLPGSQGALVEALLATGTPLVLVVLSGRPYALGRYAAATEQGAGRGAGHGAAAVVQAFFPGEEGGTALAGVLAGRVNPSGRLPVSVPYGPGGQPWTYLAPPLGHRGEASSLDPTPLYPFGHGLSYTDFHWRDAAVVAPESDGGEGESESGRVRGEAVGEVPLDTDEEATVRVTVTNTGERAGTEVVQLYLHDPVARTARPVQRLVGYARVPLAPGESAEVRFAFHPDLASYTVREGHRVVEPGALELRLAASSADVRRRLALRLTGPERRVGYGRRMVCPVSVRRTDGANGANGALREPEHEGREGREAGSALEGGEGNPARGSGAAPADGAPAAPPHADGGRRTPFHSSR
ncbi:beta-xylosidase/alpha-l-arabinosidase [Streptomyces sp. NPDC054796]